MRKKHHPSAVTNNIRYLDWLIIGTICVLVCISLALLLIKTLGKYIKFGRVTNSER